VDLNILAVMKQLAELQVALQKQVRGLGPNRLAWLCLVCLPGLSCLVLRACLPAVAGPAWACLPCPACTQHTYCQPIHAPPLPSF
jgi:hypothetical protein